MAFPGEIKRPTLPGEFNEQQRQVSALERVLPPSPGDSTCQVVVSMPSRPSTDDETNPFYPPTPATIVDLRIDLNDVTTGDAVFEVLRNGSTVGEFTVPDGERTSGRLTLQTVYAPTDLFTVKCTDPGGGWAQGTISTGWTTGRPWIISGGLLFPASGGGSDVSTLVLGVMGEPLTLEAADDTFISLYERVLGGPGFGYSIETVGGNDRLRITESGLYLIEVNFKFAYTDGGDAGTDNSVVVNTSWYGQIAWPYPTRSAGGSWLTTGQLWEHVDLSGPGDYEDFFFSFYVDGANDCTATAVSMNATRIGDATDL